MTIHSEGINPTDDEREALDWALTYARRYWQHGGEPESQRALSVLASALRRTEVPEPSTEVLGEWFTSSHGVAVAAVAPMTDRGPSVMVDGRVISPNDVAALIEFKTQGEPSEPSDAGVGWFEWFKMPENTTEIAYVHENGEVFDPVRGWNPVEFTIAAAEGRVHRLVRAGGVR